MDPLSVAASVVGILTAATQISSCISDLVTSTKSAPKEIIGIRDEVQSIHSVLSQLQILLVKHEAVNKMRTSLILVDQVVITLSAIATTLSELDVFVKTLAQDDKMKILDRAKWSTKKKSATESLTKLQAQKTSLTLMLTILTCDSTLRAENAVSPLCVVMERILDGQLLLTQRLANIEMKIIPGTDVNPIDAPTSLNDQSETTIQSLHGFIFEEELNSSWVYRRVARNPNIGNFSIVSSAGRTASWSMLSGLSLSDLSNIAVLALPIYAADLSNSALYQFGESDITISENSPGRMTADGLNNSKRHSSGLRQLLRTMGRRDRELPSKSLEQDKAVSTGPIFGVHLQASLEVSSVPIAHATKDNHSFAIAGYLPTVIGRCGAFIKEKGLNDELIFAVSGSATNIRNLQMLFSDKDHTTDGPYGAGYVFEYNNRITVKDAASLILRYIKLLPEPVINFECYQSFMAILGVLPSSVDVLDEISWPLLGEQTKDHVVAKALKAVGSLPRNNRRLLLYLLDLIQNFAKDTNKNLLDSNKLIAAFQPGLLSLEPEDMSINEYRRAHQVLVLLLEILDSIPWEESYYTVTGKRQLRAKFDSQQTDLFENPRSLV